MPRLVALAVLLTLVACASGPEEPVDTKGSGPPEIQTEVVSRHDAQLDEELGARPAGSQQEQIASQYILGHLQRAGYLVRLEAVPVENLVESSNLLAVPPSGDDPDVVVVTGYDTPANKPSGGEEVGFLLELARAFNVASPEHTAEFAALGADAGEDRLGSRRLARLLLDEGVEASVIEIGEVESGVPVSAVGPGAPAIDEAQQPEIFVESVFSDAGFEWTMVSGDPADMGSILIDHLAQAAG
jgi:hypothetical protein